MSNQLVNKGSAHDIVAFAVVELGAQLPLNTLMNMTTDDPLYLALVEAWRRKEEREHTRFAMVAFNIVRQLGNKKVKFADFLPKKKLSPEEEVEQHKRNMALYKMKQEIKKGS